MDKFTSIEEARIEALLARGMSREKAARIVAAEASGEPETYEDWADDDLFGYAADLEIPDSPGMTRAELIAALTSR